MAAWCISFFGIQPTFTHVPPKPTLGRKACKSVKTLFLFINYYYYLYIINNRNIVKHGSSEHAYNELTDTVK